VGPASGIALQIWKWLDEDSLKMKRPLCLGWMDEMLGSLSLEEKFTLG
jgi:hypothetical protein